MVALHPLSPDELAGTRTVFASFMGDADTRRKTVTELLAIYRERSWRFPPEEDVDDHLRVTRFMADMVDRRWRDEVVVRIGIFDDEVLVIDGIHRSIAYLGCVRAGVCADLLPPLCVER